MTWMLTRNGAAVDLRFMMPADISALDIAAALSKINRFVGHTSRLYSVAEHSLHVTQVMEREMGITDLAVLFAGLMHDAHEAYTGDLHSPMKQIIGHVWEYHERRIQRQVLERFGALQAYTRHHDAIKLADITMLATERRDLMPAGGPQWESLEGIDPLPEYRLQDFAGMEPDDWRDAFVERFGELFDGGVDAAGIGGGDWKLQTR